MKHAILISVLMFLFRSSYACSCEDGWSFCNTHNQYDFSGSCIIVDRFQYGISLKVLQVFHGSENRDTINVWDYSNSYYMCYDSLHYANSAFLGNIGDTIIIALPVINTIKNDWDVIGDYRMHGYQCDRYNLSVNNDTVSGFISGYYDFTPFYGCVCKYAYNDFLIDFPIKSLSCQTWTNTTEYPAHEILNYYPNPATDKIVFTTTENGMLTIVNDLGQFIDVVSVTNNQTQISTSNLRPGIYFLAFQTEKSIITRKLVIQQ